MATTQQHTEKTEDFYTIDQALEMLGLRGKNAARNLHRWRKDGRIKDLERGEGGRVRLDKNSVEELARDRAKKSSGCSNLHCQVAGEEDAGMLEAKLDDVMAAVQEGFGNMILVRDITAQRNALAVACTKLECELVAERLKFAELEGKCRICDIGKVLDYFKRIFWR